MRPLRDGGEGAVSEEWARDEFEARLAARDRVVVLFHADWCPFSRAFLARFEEADEESSVPFVRANLHHPMDPRWDEHRIHVVPTLAYFENGEELEREEGARGVGLSGRDLARFLDHVEALQDPGPQRRRTDGRPRVQR